eukprot:6615842-Pyramimonas_sp.AAC.1
MLIRRGESCRIRSAVPSDQMDGGPHQMPPQGRRGGSPTSVGRFSLAGEGSIMSIMQSAASLWQERDRLREEQQRIQEETAFFKRRLQARGGTP